MMSCNCRVQWPSIRWRLQAVSDVARTVMVWRAVAPARDAAVRIDCTDHRQRGAEQRIDACEVKS